MSSFKVNISLQAEFTSQELADFFSALAKSEKGELEPLVRILHPIQPPPPPAQPVSDEPPSPIPVVEDEPPVPPPTQVEATAEPAVTEALKHQLMGTDISCARLNSIIRRHDWARGQKARIERRWGFSKASCFARIGFHFNDYSLMNGTVSSEQDLVNWLAARGFTRPL